MGAWSGEPFGNDSAADWAFELDEQASWGLVDATLSAVLDEGYVDADAATLAIAAAETVAHGLGRPTQDDAYTESVTAFVARAPAPGNELVEKAAAALARASSSESELAELWADDPAEWEAANTALQAALMG